MTIPATITTELANLQAQVTAATPLSAASQATVKAMQLNAAKLVTDVQGALVAPANTLDTFVSPVDPAAIITGITGLLTAAQDQNKLALMRGIVGRVASNLSQIV